MSTKDNRRVRCDQYEGEIAALECAFQVGGSKVWVKGAYISYARASAIDYRSIEWPVMLDSETVCKKVALEIQECDNRIRLRVCCCS